ncbi:MAG: hemerythrin domain-containing protein [Actinomycetota bacterium]|nr:hemerythrin domain-containing protein [Actinomycetota bacterium]
MDALELLTSQHNEVERLFSEYEQLGPGQAERKKQIARQVITDLSMHAGVEEVAFYPTVREALPDTEQEIQEDLEEHERVKQTLSNIQGMEPTDPQFDAEFQQVISDVRHHVNEEENQLFPRVRQGMSDQELRDLGEAMQELKSRVPTNPHPHAPQEPPANVVLGPVAGMLDRVRDAIRQRTGKKTV